MELASTTKIAISKNIPQLRFPEFDATYREYIFSDIFNFSTGKNIKQAQASPDFEISCVRYGELYHMYDEVIEKVNNKTNLDRKDLTFSKGDEILIPSAGEDPLDIGSASALTLSNIAIGRTINILKPKNKDYYSHRYVSFYINQKLKKEIARLAKGVSISNVYNSDLKKIKINLPCLPEQQKNANFLTQVDRKIELLDKQQATLEQYKKGVMQKIFNQEIRFKIKNKAGELVELPDWEEKKLGNYLTLNKKRNKDLKVEKILSVSNTKGFITQSEQFDDHRVASKDLSNYRIVKKYDIAYNPSRINVGSIAVLKNFEKGVVSPMYVVFSLKDSLNLHFFENLIQTHLFNHLVKVGCSGSVRDSLNYEELEKFKLKFPCLEEQTKIANFLTAIDTKIEVVAERSRSHREWKKGLLQKMFV